MEKETWNDCAGDYANAMVHFRGHRAAREAGFEWLKQCHPNTPQTNVLNIGCGPGLFEMEARAVHGSKHTFTGVDNASSMLSIAQERNPGNQYIEAEMFQYLASLPEGSVEYIMAMNSLITSEQKLPLLLSELYRVLKPEGHLFVSIVHKIQRPQFVLSHADLKNGGNISNWIRALSYMFSHWSEMKELREFIKWAGKIEKNEKNKIFLSHDEWAHYLRETGFLVPHMSYFGGNDAYGHCTVYNGPSPGSLFFCTKPRVLSID